MTDSEIVEALAQLGIDRESYRLVLLLPLVQVAWADGAVQSQERELILRVARQHGLLSGSASQVLKGWLRHSPQPEEVQLGRDVLVALTHRHRGLGSELNTGDLRDVASTCKEVARAAGGLFDLLFTVEPAEQAALQEITRGLLAGKSALLSDLPSPEGGAWVDLDDDLS